MSARDDHESALYYAAGGPLRDTNWDDDEGAPVADRGVVNAAEVLAKDVIEDALWDWKDFLDTPSKSLSGDCGHGRGSCHGTADHITAALLAASPSGDGGPVVIFPDRTLGHYPTLSEEEQFVLRSALEDYSGSEAEHAHDLTLHSPDRLAEAHLLMDRCRVADALADRLAPSPIQDGTREEGE